MGLLSGDADAEDTDAGSATGKIVDAGVGAARGGGCGAASTTGAGTGWDDEASPTESSMDSILSRSCFSSASFCSLMDFS